MAGDETFHRLESPTQTREDALRQVQSSEVWGRPARGSAIPSVRAYRKNIPVARRGIEFTTLIEPHPGSGSPYEARWYYPHTPGVLLRTRNYEDFAAIPADVTNLQP
jgi:hypothetical protein